jgi:transcriptional regulator with XRE-family HTH domain
MNSSYTTHKIGPKIRDLRKEKNINLSEMADRSGISSPMISKIENGRLIPTIPTLLSLLNVLEISTDVFFSEINNEQAFTEYIHQKKDDFKKYIKEESAIGFLYESIHEHNLEKHSIQISQVSLEPNNKRPLVTTDAFELLYIIEGKIEYHLDHEIIELNEGESFFFDGNIPHVPLNKTNKKARYIVIYFFKNKY